MSKRPASFVARAHGYARQVVAGKVPACRWVRLACQRHLDDLKRSRTAAYPYRFDEAKAERACRFAELFPHVKGQWATPVAGKPESTRIRLADWQCFYRASVWGWVEKRSGLRRFRRAYLGVPRKNGKSVTAALDGLQAFAADAETGAEVYSGATTEKQAWEVFRPAKQMAERTPAFLEAYGVEVHASNLAIPANGARFEPIIGKPGDGASPSCAIVDEYHEHLDSALYDTMLTGMGARTQPLLMVITTAGENISGPCYALMEQVQRMLDGTQPDEQLFGLLYGLDEGDDWTTEAALRKANPNFGVSVSADFLKQQQRVAIQSAREQAVFKTKHLNVWVTSRVAWLNMEKWHRQADPELTLASFAGSPCYIGLDLASKVDLAAKVRLFPRTLDGIEHYFIFGEFYCPEAAVADPRNRHYQGWVHDGHLVATEGNEIDQERIKLGLLEDARTFQVQEIAFDEWGAIKMAQELEAAGLTVVRIPQRVQHLSEPMKMLEASLMSGRLHHPGNPCLGWQMSNVTVKVDANDNIFPRKERSENKIDGAVAAIMALSRALLMAPASIYEQRGFLEV